MSRENAYILLELDPERDTTWAAVEPALRKKRLHWSQQQQHPTKKLEFKKYLGWFKEIEAVLRDDRLRLEEAEEAKLIYAGRRAKALQDLDDQLDITGAKRYLTEEDVRHLIRPDCDEKTVRARAKAKSLPIREGSKEAEARERLDPAMEKKIDEALRIAEVADLYELLDLPSNAPVAELRRQADERYQTLRTHSDKSKADVNARLELLRISLGAFKDNDSKARYDNTLVWQRGGKEIETRTLDAGRGEGRLLVEVVDQLIIRGKRLGLTEEQSRAIVVAVGKQHGWPVSEPVEPTARTVEICRLCGEASSPDSPNCGHCGRPYAIACPRCSSSNRNGADVCRECGFALSGMAEGERLLRSAQGLKVDDPSTAAQRVAEALALWPRHPQAMVLERELRGQRDREQTLESNVLTAIASRTFEAAWIAVQALTRAIPHHGKLTVYQAQIRTALADAKRHVAKARRHPPGSDAALEEYRRALAICEDCQEAQAGVSSCRPAPPAKLDAAAVGCAVRLIWSASPSHGELRYRVVRKPFSAPKNPEDGVSLAATSTTSLADPELPPGVEHYYAVFTERDDVVSASAALTGPVVGAAEVTDLRAQIDDGAALLTWAPPPNARAVEVYRQSGSEPPKAGDGERVASTLQSAEDRGLTNGTLYGYRVVAVFTTSNGKTIRSAGATCLACPAKLPPRVTDLRIAVGEGQFTAAWTPTAGDVRIYHLLEPIDIPSGTIVSMADLNRFGQPVSAAGRGLARGKLDGRTELRLLPVTFADSVGVAGKTCRQNCIPDVENVRGKLQDHVLSVRWDWPAGVQSADVVYRTDRFAQHAGDCTPTQKRKALSPADARLRIEVPGVDRLYVTVFARIDRGDRTEYSRGHGIGCRREMVARSHRRVWYRIEPIRSMLMETGEYRLIVQAEQPTLLPKLVLVGRADGLPVERYEGEAIYETPEMECGPGHSLQFSFRPPWSLSQKQVRLFPVEDEDADWLQLRSRAPVSWRIW